jgi:endonuclease YncB( thermonuclease family)
MRKLALVAAGLVGLAGLIVAVVLDRPAAPPPTPETPQANLPDVPPTPEAPASRAPALVQAAPPKPAVPDLPTIEVAPRPIHTVPDEEPAAAPRVTIFDRQGKEQRSREASLTPPPPAAPLPPPMTFGGTAQAAGGTTLAVAGRSVRLFGVRVADPRDRCGLGPGDGRSCADVARDALAQRLKRYPMVSCHVPAGQRGDPGAICVDNSGTDLGGFLVAEGLALADTGQSYEYFGSEGVARSFRRGLWGNR